MRAEIYKTKQSEMIRDCLRELGGGHFTVGQLEARFRARGISIGTATIYRHLEKLATAGEVRKYMLGGNSGACFQYVPDAECAAHFHFVCESCGQVTHLECGTIKKLEEHFAESHNMDIDLGKTVFQGVCSGCRDR